MSAVDHLIQNGITQTTPGKWLLVRGSTGTLYTVYTKGSSQLYLSYSTDDGTTWTEIARSTGNAAQNAQVAIAIDSTDTIHVVFAQDSSFLPLYTSFSSGAWSASETTLNIFSASAYTIAVDSADNVHMAYVQNSTSVQYVKKTGASFSTPLQVASIAGSLFSTNMVMDANDAIYIVFAGGVGSQLFYVKYVTSWTSATALDTLAGLDSVALVMDSNRDAHLLYRGKPSSTYYLYYIKYNHITDVWSSPVQLTTSVEPGYASVAIEGINTIDVLFYDKTTGYDVYFLQNISGTWGSDSMVSLSGTQPWFPFTHTCIFPIIAGVSTQMPTLGYYMAYYTTGNALRYYATSDLTFPTTGEAAIYNAGTNGKLKIASPLGTKNIPTLDASGILNPRTYTLPDIGGVISIATSGSSAPATVPPEIGLIYVDTSGPDVYISTGTASTSDWTLVT